MLALPLYLLIADNFLEHCKKIAELYQASGAEIVSIRQSLGDSAENLWKLFVNGIDIYIYIYRSIDR